MKIQTMFWQRLGEIVKCEKEVYKTHDKSIEAQKYIERSANTSLTDVMEEAHHQGKIVFRLNWNQYRSLRSHLLISVLGVMLRVWDRMENWRVIHNFKMGWKYCLQTPNHWMIWPQI